MAERWAVHDDSDPIRRVMFGSQEAADSFASSNPGWTVVGEGDPRWRPLPGDPGWEGWPDVSPSP